MNKWQTEDEIKAELRDLATEVRKVRGALEEIVKQPPGTGRERRYLHAEPDRRAFGGEHGDVQRKKKRDR